MTSTADVCATDLQGGCCVGNAFDGALQQLVALEDLLLLAQYDEAAKASADLVSRFTKEGFACDAFLQRALVTTFQAHFFIGRSHDVDSLVGDIGLQRLAVPTFMAWALLLLESQQAAAARLRVEQYMSAIITLLRERQLAPPITHGAHAAAGPDPATPSSHTLTPSPLSTTAAPTTTAASAPPEPQSAEAEVAGRTGPLSVSSNGEYGSSVSVTGSVGAAAATLHDRAALARLYSQDVLCLGLGLPLEALRWLQPSPSSAAAASGQPPQQRQLWRPLSVKAGGSGHPPACPAVAGDVAVVDAGELVGGKEVLERLQEELKQLMAIAGMVPPEGLPDGAALQGAAQAQVTAAAVAAAAGDGASSEAGVNGRVSQGHAAQKAGRDGGGPSGTAAGNGVASRAHCGAAPTSAAGSNQPGSQAGHVQQGPMRAPVTAILTLFRSLLAATHAVARRLFLGAVLQLTRAQAWLVCKAAAATSRLRSLSAVGGGAGRGTPVRLPGGSLGRVALVVAVAVLVVVAAQAEAPHLRTTLERQWALLAGMVREAVRMGLALHPSPVATSAAIP